MFKTEVTERKPEAIKYDVQSVSKLNDIASFQKTIQPIKS